jgi:predicted metalloprotease with PDZ domain
MILGEAKDIKGLMGLMAHEGAHSWYQQMLATNESVRPWMDEGFTSYAEGYTMYQLFPEELPNPFANTLNAYRNFVKKALKNLLSG